MSSGQHHAGMTKGLAAGLGIGAVSSLFLHPVEILFMTAGCLLGIVLNPDNDSDGGNIGYSYIESIFGRYGLAIWKLLWTPYRIGIKHRSFWSHTPIIGTTVRLIYCVLPIILILLKDQESTPIYEIIPKALLAQTVAIPFIALIGAVLYYLWLYFPDIDWIMLGLSLFTGLCIADFGHWVLDM